MHLPRPRPVLNTHVRFSSLMELRMKAGFRAREICVMSCSSVGHRAGWAGAKQVLVPRPHSTGPGGKPGAVPSAICPWQERLPPTPCKGSSSQNTTGPLGSSELGMRRGAHCSRNGPPPSPASSRFSCFPPRAPEHKHPCPACCVSTSECFFMHASRCCRQPPSPESLSPIYR